jgi:hypothetical protein
MYLVLEVNWPKIEFYYAQINYWKSIDHHTFLAYEVQKRQATFRRNLKL